MKSSQNIVRKYRTKRHEQFSIEMKSSSFANKIEGNCRIEYYFKNHFSKTYLRNHFHDKIKTR